MNVEKIERPKYNRRVRLSDRRPEVIDHIRKVNKSRRVRNEAPRA